MGEQTQQPAGLGKLFFCPAEEFERLGMAAPMQEIQLAEPSRLSPVMLTYKDGDDGSTKDSGAWENPMHHSFEITGKAVVTNVGNPIRELLNDMPNKVDVEIRREIGKMPRKMKKAYRIGSRYRRDTKWKRKAKLYERRFIYRLPNAEMVVTREQFGVLEATIKGSGLQYNPDAHVSRKDIDKALAAYVKRR